MKRQGGWVGMLVILLALVIVAYLAKDALTKYGIVPDMETVEKKAGRRRSGTHGCDNDDAGTENADGRGARSREIAAGAKPEARRRVLAE